MWNDFSRFMQALMTRLAVRGEEGQGLVEYALILSLVSIATIIILGAIGTDIGKVFSSVTSAL
jgi:pilus assembly protein Flp/PilA